MKTTIHIYIGKLIERFLEGETSNQEEQELYDFFSGEDIPEDLIQYKPLFHFFAYDFNKRLIDKGRQVETFPLDKRQTGWLKWTAVAAVALLCVTIGTSWFFRETKPSVESENFVVINGIKFTDPEIIQAQSDLMLLQHLYEEAVIEEFLLESGLASEDGDWNRVKIIIRE